MNFILKQRQKEREIFFADAYIKNSKIAKNISLVVVSHLIESSIAYIKVLDKYFSLELIIPKPKSIDKKYFKLFPQDKILRLDRDKLKNSNIILKKLKKVPKNNKILFIDIGGYFSEISNDLKNNLGDKFLGIIEDTENGHQKYLKKGNINFPLISVARSPLKENEDHIVGQGVVFSTEAIIKEQGILLNNKKVGVIGFGKIGKGVLSCLRDKGCDISVYDKNAVILAIAFSKGYKILNKEKIIKEADMVFCATGNLALKKDEFKKLKNGSFIASVTSSDDELDLDWVDRNYSKEVISFYIDKYYRRSHYFYILNKGNAINFVHGGGIDNFILLVQKEIMDCIVYLASNKQLENGLQESPEEIKQRIATLWMRHFAGVDIKRL